MIKGGYYIKARCIQNSEISSAPPHVREIWDWLIKEANFQENTLHGITLKRGQCLTDYKSIIEGLTWYVGYRKCGYSKGNCETALKWLRKRNMIQTMKTTRGIVVTICKYECYQSPENYETYTKQKPKPTREPQSTYTLYNKEGEEGKKETPPLPPKGENAKPKQGQSKTQNGSPAGVGVGARGVEVPEYSEFLKYAVEQEPKVDQKALRAKYDTWVDDGWKDGHGKPIKSWKNKIRNTLGYLPKTNAVQEYRSTHKYDHSKLRNGETYLDRLVRNKIDPRDTDEVAVFVSEENLQDSYVKIIQHHFKTNPELFPHVQN